MPDEIILLIVSVCCQSFLSWVVLRGIKGDRIFSFEHVTKFMPIYQKFASAYIVLLIGLVMFLSMGSALQTQDISEGSFICFLIKILMYIPIYALGGANFSDGSKKYREWTLYVLSSVVFELGIFIFLLPINL